MIVGITLALGLAGCGGASVATTTTAATGPHDPCHGVDLSLGEAAMHCRAEGEADAPPTTEVVDVTIATRALQSGADGVVDVVFRNVSSAPIELSFPGSLHFDPSIWDGERRIDERWEISGLAGGSIGCRAGVDCRPVRVLLEPQGALTASLPLAVRTIVLRDGATAGTTERSDAGPIAPGEYEVRVLLPWMDAVAGTTTGARTPRIVRAPLSITR
ncbi:MAG: hypothetical protein M3Y87_17850 [Myxococcota bacterium]|nr:hypothetical protein [Myxococcota bacterium]